MYKKTRLISVLIILIFCFALPLNASDSSFEDVNSYLKKGSIEDLMDIMRKKPLAQANFDLFYESIEGYNSNAPRKTGAVVLVKQAILKEQLGYWFKDLPEQLSIKFIKNTFAVVSIIYSNDVSQAIKIIEKLSVKKATEYAINWLFQNKIKIGTGELSYSFSSYKGNWQNIKIQYIIAYHFLSQNKGEIIAEFCSKNPIEPPIGTNPWGCPDSIFDHPKSICFPWDYWLENERNRDNDGKIEPFILRIKGYVTEKNPPLFLIPGINDYPTYSRNDNECNLSIEIDFDSLVPEIENSDFILANPPSETSFKKEIIKILLEKVKSKANFAKDFTLEKANDVKNVTVNFFDKIKSLFSKSDSGADISEQIIWDENDSWQTPLIQESDSISDLNIVEQELLEMQKKLEEEIQRTLEQQDLEDAEKIAVLEKMRQQLDYISRTLLEMRRRIQEYLAKQKPEEELLVCSISDTKYIPERDKIIFNEIAWMGTKNSSNDEWMELKNISESTIDMNNWQILDKAGLEDNTKGISIVFENAIISQDSFYLLERTDDTSVPNITADLIYTGALNNTDEALYLFDKNCRLQDKVEAIPTWGYGSNSSKATMERKTDLSWQTSESFEGTPNADNSSGSYEDSEAIDTENNNDNDDNNESNQNTSSSGGSSSSAPPPVFYPVLINEIMYNLDGSDDGREWIEIFNSADTSVDLSNWKLYENGTNHGLTLIQGTSVLSPDQYAVIVDDKNEFLKDYPAHSGTIFDSCFSLSNDGEELTIKNQELFIDKINYSSTWEADGNGDSLQKITPELDSDNSSNWKPAPPTPGAINTFPSASSTSTTTSTTATSTSATSTTSTTTNYSALDVVINEIAWMGTKANYTDEWIELYNNTNQEIDLNNWIITWEQGTSTHSVDLTGNMSAYGFCLLERTSSTTVSDIQETQIYTGAMGNGGENMKLTDLNSDLIDEVDCSGGWFAGDNDTKQTMERISPRTSGNDSTNWANNNTQTINGLDADNNSILGTPNAKNSVFSTLPPNPVPNFSIDQENSKYNIAVLTWSTTTDPDTLEQDISYLIYWDKQEITEQNASTTSPTAFSTSTATTTLILTNLDYNSTYYFGIRAFDNENYSSLSTSTSYNTPLSAITDLSAGTSAIRKAIDLFWTSNGAKDYIIKRAEKEIVENTTSSDKISWGQADFVSTSSAIATGEIENLVIKDLDSERTYYFAIRSINTTDAVSEISNLSKSEAISGFADNSNQTITDLYTNLMWVKNGNGLANNNGATSTWNETVSFIDDLNSTTTGGFAGYNDWRLPNFKELASIIDYSKDSPIIDENYFPNTKSAKYWTSNKVNLNVQYQCGDQPYRTYYVDFNNGYIDYYDWGGGYTYTPSPYYYIRLVRDLSTTTTNILSPTGLQGDPPTACSSGCTDNSNETITDNCTNLMWVKGEIEALIGNQNTISWKSAFNLCNNLTTAGYNDWRLPNIMEIINASNKNGSDILSWKSGLSGYYWSSTLSDDKVWITGNGYYVGKLQTLLKSSNRYIQCLRK